MDHHVEQRVRRSLTPALIAAAAMSVAGCDNQASVFLPPQGLVTVALVIPGGATISSVSWAVKSASQQVVASGTANTSRTGATVSLAVGVPPGNADVVTMMATTNA